MKKFIVFMGLLAFGAFQMYGMEMETQPNVLNKEQQKEFRAILAGYRGAFILQQMLEATGRKEVKAETRLRKDQEELLNDYQRIHGTDPYVAKKFKRLEKFKNEEIPSIFAKLRELKTEEI
ncbi:MAG TPA: hypothetical protein VHX42_03070 [Candidatus Babeliales bacterium]|jgi:predicted metal-binding protein|nr:hypothetical protein [Candidatus Babeliales bacterium]